MTSPISQTAATTGEMPYAAASEPQSEPRRDGRRKLNWFWIVVGVPALALVAVVLMLRWSTPRSPLTIAMVGVAPFMAAPVLFGLASSWFSRSRAMRLGAGVVAAVFLVTMSPVDAVIGCGGRTASDSITIYTANVLFEGGRAEDLATSALTAEADIIVLQEASFPFVDTLAADSRMADYQYRSNQLTWESPRTVIWSRFPISSYEIEPFIVTNLLTVTVAAPGGDFAVTGLHTLAPVRDRYVGTWLRQFELLTEIDPSTPRVIAGDFNATTDHKPLRTLQQAGWTDVHDEAGCGLDNTWPVDQGLPISVMRLDHVLVSEHFEVLDLDFGDPAGSDHKPVIASVRLR